jgi:quercetin dioxygenase-like cupin family protein
MRVASKSVEEAPGEAIRWQWAAEHGAPALAARLIEVQPGAAPPHHPHAHGHEVCILEGQARLRATLVT